MTLQVRVHVQPLPHSEAANLYGFSKSCGGNRQSGFSSQRLRKSRIKHEPMLVSRGRKNKPSKCLSVEKHRPLNPCPKGLLAPLFSHPGQPGTGALPYAQIWYYVSSPASARSSLCIPPSLRNSTVFGDTHFCVSDDECRSAKRRSG
jgi:hypothetical protein